MTISGTTPDGVGFTVHGGYADDADVAAALLKPRPVKHERPVVRKWTRRQCIQPGCCAPSLDYCADHQPEESGRDERG